MTDNFKVSFVPYCLKFKEPGGTSRGILLEKLTYFLRVQSLDNQEIVSYGEVPVFPGLSKESVKQVEKGLYSLTLLNRYEDIFLDTGISSINFGLEQIKNYFDNLDSQVCFPSDFTHGHSSIPINGLIWMGSYQDMKDRIDEKVHQGFKCIKLKIGSLHWEDELNLLKYIRDQYGNDLTLRVDANGAFLPEECLSKLDQLANFEIHSIEQPIKAGQWKELEKICNLSPIPIAIDEEIIGIPIGEKRNELLGCIKPDYLILKPALCFGFQGCRDWIQRASERGIGWWITSALESNVGLDAIAEFTGQYNLSIPQGLGTGSLFTNNFSSPLYLSDDQLYFRGPSKIFYSELSNLAWIN